MLASAGGLNGGVQCQKVGLLRKVVDDFNNFTDVIGAVAQNVDDFRGRLNRVIGAIEAVGGLLHGGDAADHFFARAIRDVEQNLGSICHAIDGSNHLVDRSGSF